MSWLGIEAHDEIAEQFRTALARGRLASTFLFVGPRGVGKRMFALRLAQALLCQARAAEELNPCGKCDSCVQAAAGTHPDLIVVGKPEERSFIPVETFIGTSDKRMQAGLCHDLSLKPFMGGRRIAIIDDADHLNEEGANCLLKTLEEPPPKSLLILIGTSASRQLPTIRSRAQIVRFGALDDATVAKLLIEQEVTADAAEAMRLAAASRGSLETARELAEPGQVEFRQRLMVQLADPTFDSVALAKEVSVFVEAAGKEAPARRARARQAIAAAIEHYEALLKQLSAVRTARDDMHGAHADQAVQSSTQIDAVVACIERSLDALEHIDRNANMSLLIEWWADEISRATLGAT